jgi:hypothetical protein
MGFLNDTEYINTRSSLFCFAEFRENPTQHLWLRFSRKSRRRQKDSSQALIVEFTAYLSMYTVKKKRAQSNLKKDNFLMILTLLFSNFIIIYDYYFLNEHLCNQFVGYFRI